MGAKVRTLFLGAALAALVACGGATATPLGHRRPPRMAEDPAAPVRVVQLAAGTIHTCALRSDGAVLCWGSNSLGQLGVEGRVIGWDPARVPDLDGVVQIAAASYATCARCRDGSVRCWGAVRRALGSRAANVDALAGAVDLAVGDDQVCAVLGDASVVCKSLSDRSPARGIQGASPAEQVAAGYEHACALRRDGTVSCWGGNRYGELGIGSTAPDARVVQVDGLRDVAQIHASNHHTCAWERDGTVTCWGELGVDAPVTSPVPVPLTEGLSGVAATYDKACGWFADGSIRCVRRGPDGGPQLSRVTLGRGAVQLVAGPGTGYFCGLDTAGTVACWGGPGDHGEIGNPGRVRGLPGRVPDLDDARDLVATSKYACALRATGQIVCWGHHPLPERTLRATTDEARGAVRLAAGSEELCAVLDDGTARCWGSRWMPRASPTQEQEGFVAPFSGVRAMAMGIRFACALGADGHVRCMGVNYRGQLGDGTTDTRDAPVTVQGLSGVAEIATEGEQTCARLAGGTVKCWGAVGNDDEPPPPGDAMEGPDHLKQDFLTGAALSSRRWSAQIATSPQEIAGLDGVVRLMDVGPSLCAVRRDGTVVCWGTADHPRPQRAAALDHALDLAGSFQHACVLFADRRVGCTGSNDYGQLGRGTRWPATIQPMPIAGVEQAEQVVTGEGFSCVRLRGGGVRCWGSNRGGELGGGGGRVEHESPVVIDGLTIR